MLRVRTALVLGLICSSSLLCAQGSSQADLVRSLNGSLLRIHGQVQGANAGQAAALRSQAVPILEQRAAAMRTLIALNPEEALQLAFSPDLLADLARSFPQAAASLESHGVWEAPVEYVIFDDTSMMIHRRDIRMIVAGQELDIHFAGHEPPGLKCGDILQVAGVRSGDRVAAAGGSVSGSSVAAAGCSTKGAQNIAVLLVTFPGIAPPVAPATVYDIFFATSGRSVDGYWKEGSYNQTNATGDVFGWYTLSQIYTCDQYSAMRSAAIAAADADVFFPNYTRIMIVFPNPGSCGWAGLGTLGCGTLSSADGNFTASTSWLLATYMTSRDNGVKLSTHEGGHNLTLHHASSRDFGAEALGPVGSAGGLSEYGDVFNTMGSWNLGHYGAPHKVMLNWLTMGSNVQTVESNGSFSIQPLETNPAGLQALKVRRGTGNNAWLWFEYRQPIGSYDTTLNSQVFGGALVHYEDSTTGTHTHLLDFTPETSSWSDPAKLPGTGTYTDPYSNLSFSVDSASLSALGVTVSYGPVPCVAANPTVSVTPSNPSGQAGQDIPYTVTVTNNDSSSCVASDFSLSSPGPSGWTTSLAGMVTGVAPGQSKATPMTKKAPTGTTPNTYSFSTTATRGSNNNMSNASATIVPAPVTPAVVVDVLGTTYAPRSTVSSKATVTAGGNAAGGATVVFTMKKPNNKTTTKTVTAGSNGVATWNYRLGPKDPTGTYQVWATATYNGQPSTSNTDTFVVQ